MERHLCGLSRQASAPSLKWVRRSSWSSTATDTSALWRRLLSLSRRVTFRAPGGCRPNTSTAWRIGPRGNTINPHFITRKICVGRRHRRRNGRTFRALLCLNINWRNGEKYPLPWRKLFPPLTDFWCLLTLKCLSEIFYFCKILERENLSKCKKAAFKLSSFYMTSDFM